MTIVPRQWHPVEVLIERLASVAPYPSNVVEVIASKRIAGTAFFPGGHGLWAPSGQMTALRAHPVMLLGNNWGIVSDHDKARHAAAESTSDPTWRNLLAILELSGIRPEDCFFTNALMGLMESASNIDEFPGLHDKAFYGRCSDFLLFQLQTIRPRLVVAMGSPAVRMLSGLTVDLKSWRGPRGGHRSFTQLEQSGSDAVWPVRVGGVESPLAAVAICHPCDRRNLSPGFAREAHLIRAACAATAEFA